MTSKLSLIMLLTVTTMSGAYAQVNQEDIQKVKAQCEEVVRLDSVVQAKTDKYDALVTDIRTLKDNWRKVCEEVLADSEYTSEDITYLLNNTDIEFDGEELYDMLTAALDSTETQPTQVTIMTVDSSTRELRMNEVTEPDPVTESSSVGHVRVDEGDTQNPSKQIKDSKTTTAKEENRKNTIEEATRSKKKFNSR